MSKLFSNLSHEGILKQEHYVKGIKAVVERISELQLDIPQVAKFVEQFIAVAVSERCVSQSAVNFPGLKT